MRLFWLIIRVIQQLFLLFLVECSLPDIVEPVKWNMHVEFPIIDQTIPVSTFLQQKPVNDLPYDTSESGDTISFVSSDTVAYTFEQKLGISDTNEFKHTLGACTIGNMDPISMQLQVASALPVRCEHPLQLNDPATISMSKKGLSIDGISYVLFDSSSPEMKITVANQTTQCEMNDVVIALMDHDDAFAVIHIPHLSVKETTTISVPVAGKKIRSPAALAVSVATPRGAVVHCSDQMNIQFSFNGLVVSEAEIEDKFINYGTTFSGILPIADSLEIEHIETENASLELNIWSPARLKVKMCGSFLNSTQPGQTKKVTRPYRDVTNKKISGMFSDDTLVALLDSTCHTFSVPLSSMDLFPDWDLSRLHSTIGCVFNISVVHEGKMLRFNKNDQLVIKMRTSRFPLKKIEGRFLKKLGHAASTSVKSGIGATTKEIKEIQNSFSFNAARLKFDLDPGISPGSSIDSLLVQVIMKAGNCRIDSVVLTQTLTDITAGSHHCAIMDFTGLFNRWPETFSFDVNLLLPTGTGFTLQRYENGNKVSDKNVSINPVLSWKAIVPLCWKVNETTLIELEKTVISLNDEQMKMAKKIESPELKIVLNILNQTNIHCRIFAVCAAKEYEKQLMEFPDTIFRSQEYLTKLPENIFTVTGNAGVVLAPRNGISLNEIVLDSSCIDAFISGGNCIIRWFLSIQPGETDALKSSDYFQIKAAGVIDGTGNSETLTKFD
jgi:hypothetical protein